jgi:hypothetical protein
MAVVTMAVMMLGLRRRDGDRKRGESKKGKQILLHRDVSWWYGMEAVEPAIMQAFWYATG